MLMVPKILCVGCVFVIHSGKSSRARPLQLGAIDVQLEAAFPEQNTRVKPLCLLGPRFAVTPLTEECGLVEWVHNLTALRTAIQESLTLEGLWSKATNPYIKTLYDNFQARLGLPQGPTNGLSD